MPAFLPSAVTPSAIEDDAHRTRGLVYMSGDDYAEIPLRGNSMLFGYIGTIQEEVHRFAIEYYRGLRDKGKSPARV